MSENIAIKYYDQQQKINKININYKYILKKNI